MGVCGRARERWVCVRGVYIPDLNLIATVVALFDVDVDREVGVDVSHLILIAFRHAGDEVLDDRLDGSESRDILARAVVDFDLDDVLALVVLR